MAANTDLDIDNLSETQEDNPGGLVVKRTDQPNYPRKRIILFTNQTTGNVTLTRSSSKVKVFDAASGGTEITFNGTDNKFAVGSVPPFLYVEGATESTTMRDVTLTLTHDGGSSDTVKFTVLWVELSSRHTGDLSEDNSAKNNLQSVAVPPSLALGHHLSLFNGGWDPEGSFNSRVSEFIGSVKPSNLVPADFSGSMRLEREKVAVEDSIAGKQFWGPPPNGNQSSDDVEAGADFADGWSPWRDDDPQSGGSAGKIYDIDTPGIAALWTDTQNMLHRYRLQFKFWATYNRPRCSEEREWYTRQSYKLTGSVDSGTATSGTANTLTDSSKNWTTDEWAPGAIFIEAETGKDQFRKVTGNTATTLTVIANWVTQPDATSQYRVINKDTWTVLNDIEGDNKNAEGTTNITWNLE